MIKDITKLQDITDLEKKVREILGLKNWLNLQNEPTVNGKIKIITDFIIDVFGIFFEKEEVMDKLASRLDILTTIPNEDFELTDDIMDAILGINTIVEGEDVPDEIKLDIKTLLIYIIDLLQDSVGVDNDDI